MRRLAAHPRHVVLFSLVAGLLVWPAGSLAAGSAALAVGLVALRAPREREASDRPVPDAGGAAVPWPGWAPPVLAVAAALAVLAGATLGVLRAGALDGERILALDGRPLHARAVLLEPVRVRAGRTASVRVRIAGGRAAGEQALLRVRARPAWPQVGAVVAIRGRVAPLKRFEAHQRRRGAAAAVDVDEFVPTGERRGGAAGALDRIRERAEEGLTRGLAAPEAALVRGMVLGQDERLTEAVRDDFRTSGLAHLLAVSGQNVMLLAMLVLAIGMAANARLRTRLAAALVVILLYVPLAGGGPSIQRAGVMGAAGLVAALAGTPASRWYALALAAAVTLALNPLAAGDPGWQLSFAAVAGLMALAPKLTSALARRGVPRPIAEVAALTVAATVATAPLLALHFGQVSLASVPANLAAAAAVAPIMWLGMLSGAVAQVDASLAVPLNLLNEPLLAYLQALAHAAAAVPFASVQAGPGLAVPGAALTAVGAAWLVARRASRAMVPAVAVLAVGLLAAVAVLSGRDRASPDPRTLVVSFLDVGQGDATLLQRGGASVLFDTGPPGGPVVERLRESGVTRLDALVITHAQLDHEGAAPAVIGAFEPRVILNAGAGWPTPVQRQLAADARTRQVGAGRQVLIAGMTMRFLWPPPRGPGEHPGSDPNQRALVALVSAGEFDLLLPADAESDVTAALDLPRVEALKVAHHGSEDPGLPDLLSRLQPAVAAIEVGARNLYGHPRAQTLRALAAVPQVFRTDRDGTVRLHVTPAGIRVERD